MRTSHAHPMRQAIPAARPTRGWAVAGALALLCSGVAWASFPAPREISSDEQRQWQALSVAPASAGGSTGMPMAPTEAVEPLEFAPKRVLPAIAPAPPPAPVPVDLGPLRIR